MAFFILYYLNYPYKISSDKTKLFEDCTVSMKIYLSQNDLVSNSPLDDPVISLSLECTLFTAVNFPVCFHAFTALKIMSLATSILIF